MIRTNPNHCFCPYFMALLYLFLAACGAQSGKKPAKDAAPAPPPQPATARFAFQRMSIQARMWAADAQLLRISSANLKEVPSVDGKYPAWHATFVSAKLKKARSFSYSVVDSPGNVHAGVLRGREESWLGPTGQAQPFPLQMLKVDSDEAYATAVKESRNYLKKHPEMSIHFLLEYTPRFPLPAWRVFWGQTLGSSQYAVFIDCTSGKYLQTLY
ncbi:MAG: hypothetical protein EXQ58_06485 [Acidobacteria bacterium]|nr:hypothetical protein [Acidobacteriota bacterium]